MLLHFRSAEKIKSILISDAAVHPNSTGTCAWTIWANSELWSGEGYVPGAVTDMYSGLAEAYGIYAVLQFLHHYMTLHPLTLAVKRTIHIHCDNQGVIERIQNVSPCPQPRDAIRDDYPIFAEIQDILQTMLTIRAVFHHVKGHQKETADRKLTLPEKLNIACNAQASQMQPLPITSPHCMNPLTPAGYPHLCIKNHCVIQCLQHALCNAATQQPYFEYLNTKYEWQETSEYTVHWPVICLSLKRFKATERRTVVKFIHEWLPLQDCYHVQSASALHFCLSCNQQPETVEHFLDKGLERFTQSSSQASDPEWCKQHLPQYISLWTVPGPPSPNPTDTPPPPT